MKRTVLLAADGEPSDYAPLVAALAAAGERAGWLELGSAARPPAELEAAAAAGVLRAVGAAPGRVVTVKPLRGAPVLADLVREHFRGCLVVLVRGGEGLPALRAEGEGWRLEAPSGGRAGCRSTAELLASLRRPSFWRRLESAGIQRDAAAD